MAMTQTAAGRRIFFDDSGGDRPPLLLRCGSIVTRRGWDFQTPSFSSHFRVISMDNRDAGENDPEAAPYTFADLADDTIALLDALGIDRAHALGHSMGSGIVARLAVDHPERVDHLILASGGFFERGAGESPPTPMPRGEWIEDPVARRRSRAVTSVAPGYFDNRSEELETVAQQERGNRLTYDGWLRQMQQIATHPKRAELAGIAAPTLVIHGAMDRLPVERAREMATIIPGARALIFEGVGHSPHIERAEEFNRAVIAFLEDRYDD